MDGFISTLRLSDGERSAFQRFSRRTRQPRGSPETGDARTHESQEQQFKQHMIIISIKP